MRAPGARFALALVLALALAFAAAPTAEAKLNVVTTTPDLRSIASEVGGDLVAAESLGKGTQDPHFIEAKPSYMLKAHKADLVISTGMELEIGWLPSILAGASRSDWASSTSRTPRSTKRTRRPSKRGSSRKPATGSPASRRAA
jgi:zinc/manganese transport system substrate-binding protein